MEYDGSPVSNPQEEELDYTREFLHESWERKRYYRKVSCGLAILLRRLGDNFILALEVSRSLKSKCRAEYCLSEEVHGWRNIGSEYRLRLIDTTAVSSKLPIQYFLDFR